MCAHTSSEARLRRLGAPRAEGMWSPYAYADPSPRAEAGGERRNAYKPSDRQRAPPQSGRMRPRNKGGPLLETPFGVYAVEPVVAAVRGAHAGRYSRKRRGAAEEAADARQRVPDPRGGSQRKLKLLEARSRPLRRRRRLEVKNGASHKIQNLQGAEPAKNTTTPRTLRDSSLVLQPIKTPS
jgi:hypothetical protein